MKTKRFLSLLLCVCMVLTLLPAARLTASAAATSAITLGTNGISGGGTNWVYYGDCKGAPVKWRVLSTKGNDGVYSVGAKAVSNPLFLMSEYTLDYDLVQFDPAKNTWKGSGAQIWCNNFYNSNFDLSEKAAIAATTKADGKYSNYERSSLSGDHLFFLSGEEAANSSYGFSTDSRRIAYNVASTSSADVWWLRSPYFATTDDAGIVEITGRQNIKKVYDTWSARPAFNLNSSDVLFASAIGSKSATVGANALAKVASTATTEWKLTLLDSARSFDIYETKASATAGSTITLNYSGATVYSSSAPNEYISAMIVDSSDTVLYYGKLKQPTYAAGTMDVTIPADLKTGNYTLKLFSEQCNANYDTDRASAFADVQLKVDSTVPTVNGVSPSGTGIATSGNIVISFSEAMNISVAGTVYLYTDGSSAYGAALTGGTWTHGNTVYTVPYSGLSIGVKYSLQINGFADTAGYSMVPDSGHSFTTKGSSANTFKIDSTASTGGSISPSGRATVAQGSNVTYTITPNSGYQIDRVLVDGYSVGAVSSYTFNNVTTAHTIKAVFKKTYSDVDSGCWYFNSIINISRQGIMIGIGSDCFDPEGEVTRGMMVTILFKLSRDDGLYTNVYADVRHGSWYENTAAWALSAGVACGVGANSFAPEQDLTREQLAVMLYNYAKREGCDVKCKNSALDKYSDSGSVSPWAKNAMVWAVSVGIISGDGTYLNPQGVATRAEVATIIERYEDIEDIG